MDHYPDLKTAALVFLASAMSLIMLILLLIVILYRMNHHAREQRELQSQLRTISELLGKQTHFSFSFYSFLAAMKVQHDFYLQITMQTIRMKRTKQPKRNRQHTNVHQTTKKQVV